MRDYLIYYLLSPLQMYYTSMSMLINGILSLELCYVLSNDNEVMFREDSDVKMRKEPTRKKGERERRPPRSLSV